ncbi:MAG: Mut7-C RNAse domain-containing protein [Candidatus Aminicenantes bacterium]|nr:Mut7-C RNAse domain-containing protein [Candidatus Aminicenantes bacterium]
MIFIVDCMLGKLAKWLKILGFDSLYFSKIEDSDLLALARKEGRVLLSRDNELIDKSRDIQTLFIKSENWNIQIEQVLDDFNLWKDISPYSRCIECNVKLKDLPKSRARNLVAPFVLEQADSFSICSGCGRIFWKGTHHQDMEFKIEEILRKKKKREAAGLQKKP